jgi:hypothetical protein
MRSLFIAIVLSFNLFGQSNVGYLFEELPNDSVYNYSDNLHTTVYPQSWVSNNLSISNWHSRKFKKATLNFNPLLDLGAFYSKSFNYRSGLGLNFDGTIGKKWYFRVGYIQGIFKGDSLFIPKSFVDQNFKKIEGFGDLRGRFSFTPSSLFNFQIGLDHQFIGEGCRSLFLSDYGRPYPFGLIRSRFWKVEYTVLYQFFREIGGLGWKMKNAATHHISFNATKWLNIGIFESVVFQPKDTLLNRGFEVEYLNPVIFYRPQEYSIGSSDNVLLGASFNFKYKQHQLYTQLILDEFFLSEIKAKSGWWANKYGGQIGIKGRFEMFSGKLFYRTEYNFVRPYTYAHLTSGQNYGNQGMTLAHPYGGNFMELLGEVKYQRGNFLFKLFMSYALQGLDKDGYSYGADLYQPYTLRPYEYGHKIGQGLGNNSFRMVLTGAYNISKSGRLQVFFENHLRYDSALNSVSYLPFFGLRSQLWNDYRNY